jgi:pimeloyl-ACP methyl ester carboxylesterase
MRFASGSWVLYAETFGERSDPAVVLLHGAGNSMMAWDAELCEAIAGRGRFVIRLDSRDAGQSARPPGAGPYSMHDMTADVVALLDALALPAATLIGASQGGMTAQIVAVEHPARVEGLVLISITPGGDDLPGPVEGAFGPDPEPPDWADRAAVARYLVELERPYGGRAFDEALMTRIAERTVDHAADIAAQLRFPFEVEPGPPVRERLGEVRAPAVVVHGTDDPAFPPEHGRALAAAIPGARLLELDGFGHATLPRAFWPELISSLPAPPPRGAGRAPRT